MAPDSDLKAQLDRLFLPRSVAIVGVPRGMKTGKLFLMAFQDQGFDGPLYPVHPEASEIDGLKAYPTVSAIPGPVDLAVVLVPHDRVLPVVRECAAKGVKGVVLFTAGYKETGTAEGRALEEELLSAARPAGMRLIGPNCMGLYAPRGRVSFFPGLSRESGPVGLISHSGSLANIVTRIAADKGLRFSKVASLGNECDLCAADFLEYLAEDEETGLIGAYLEGIRDGARFLAGLRRASLRKPVILWKVGLTPEGGRAAGSHTGALAGSKEVWAGVVRQGGAVPVVGFEAWVDALMAFSLLPPDLGDRLAVISGPGGLAVSAAEALGRAGLKLAELSPETRTRLAGAVPPTGTSLKNPIDIGLTASLEIEIYIQAARIAAQDPGVDAVVVIGIGLSPEANRRYTEAMIEARDQFGKPFVLVGIPGFEPGMARAFLKAGVPFFESAERAMHQYALAWQYQRWRKSGKEGEAGG